jgi:hypothetical protein
MKSQHSYEQVHIYAIFYRFKASLTNEAEEKAQPVKKAFPNIRIVLGDLDNSKVLEEESAKADVVIRTQDPDLQLFVDHETYQYEQTLQMHQTTKAQQSPLQKVLHRAILRRSLDTICIPAGLVSSVGRPCVTTTSSANGRSESTTTGLQYKISPTYRRMHFTRMLTILFFPRDPKR